MAPRYPTVRIRLAIVERSAHPALRRQITRVRRHLGPAACLGIDSHCEVVQVRDRLQYSRARTTYAHWRQIAAVHAPQICHCWCSSSAGATDCYRVSAPPLASARLITGVAGPAPAAPCRRWRARRARAFSCPRRPARCAWRGARTRSSSARERAREAALRCCMYIIRLTELSTDSDLGTV